MTTMPLARRCVRRWLVPRLWPVLSLLLLGTPAVLGRPAGDVAGAGRIPAPPSVPGQRRTAAAIAPGT